jgi:hypothetical protein
MESDQINKTQDMRDARLQSKTDVMHPRHKSIIQINPT